MASRTPFKLFTDYFGSQPSQATQHLLPPEDVTISKTERHQNKLGEGSYAKVYRGQYKGLPCAVKVFNKDCLKKELTDPEHGFEIAYLKGMTHENIVKVYGLWIDPYKGRNVTAIVMELCDDSLLWYIEKHKGRIMAIEQKLQILNGVCKGMIFLHNEGIVHGDLRAPNILLVMSDDRIIAKVSDFSMSRYVDPQNLKRLTLTHTDEDYLPPEVFHEKYQRTPKQKFACLTFEVDTFCFGTLALQLGCGEFPTPSKKVDTKVFATPTVRTEVERRSSYLKKLRQSEKEVIDPIVRRCLADKPEDRPSFTDLHTTIETKLKRYKEQPELQLLQDKIAEVERYRAMELQWKEAITNAEKLKKVLADKDDTLQAKDELLRNFEAETVVQREKIASLAKEKYEAAIAHKAQTEALLDAVAKKVAESTEASKELHTLKTELAKHSKRSPELEKEKQALLEKVSCIEDLNKDQNRKLMEGAAVADELASVKWQVEDKNKEIDALELARNNLNEQLRQQTDEKGEKMKIMEEVEKYRAQESVLKHRVEQKQSELSEMTTKKDSLDAQLVTVNEEKRALLAAERELTSKMEQTWKELKRMTVIAEKSTKEKEKEFQECQQLQEELRTLKEGKEQAKRLSEDLRLQITELQHKLEGVTAGFAKQRQQLQTRIAAGEKTNRSLEKDLEANVGKLRNMEEKIAEAIEAQKILEEEREQKIIAIRKREDKLAEAQRKELDLNDQLQLYRDQLEATKKERERVAAGFAKERQQSQTRIAAGEKANRSLEDKLAEAQRRELDLNDQVQLYRDQLEVTKKERERVAAGFAKERQQFQTRIATGEKAKRSLEDELAEAQRRELDLNDQLQLYCDQLEATKVALQAVKDKLHSTEESVCQKEKEVKKLKGDLQSERDKVQTMEEAALQNEGELDQCKASKTAVEKDLVRARKMAKDLLDERVVVNAESEQKRENLNERLMKFKRQAVLSEEHLKQVQGLEGEHHDLKIQLKTLTTTLEDFQKVLTDEQKSRKSLDASVKALTAEIDQLRTELKERDNEVSSLAATNKHLQRKVDAADVSITEMKAESTSLKEQVKSLSNDKESLKKTLDAAEAAIQKHKNDYEDCQEKLKEAEQQVALFQGKRQQLEVFERVAVELKSRLSGLMMDVSGGGDESSAIALTQEAAQKMQQLERERDSLKAEGHKYQMKLLAAENMLAAVKNDRKSLQNERDSLQRRKETLEQDSKSMMAKIAGLEEQLTVERDKLQETQDERDSLLCTKNNLEQERKDMMAKKTILEEELRVKHEDLKKTKARGLMYMLAAFRAKVHLQVTEQSLREEYKRKNSEAYEVIKRLQHPQEGSAEFPSEKTKISALMDLCNYFRDENSETLERAAEEKQKIHASMKEADERVKEMTSKVADLKECIQVKDAVIRDLQAQLAPLQRAPLQGRAVAPVSPPSDVAIADLTGDEVVLQQLCYMATGIKQLLISPDGGTFTLGNGDASLEFPPGAVQKDIHIRYAIILHGPFVLPAGYKPGSVVIYLNMDGATLVKPVLLFLSHWCIREETDDEETVKFIRAPHSLESGKKEYAFKELEDEADFTTRTNVGILTIREPHCLLCVKTKREKIGRYRVTKFTRNTPADEALLFRIQFMCDSLEWNEKLTTALEQSGWQKIIDDIMPCFSYLSAKKPIAASIVKMQGPGWMATIEGQHEVEERDFLIPKRKSKSEMEKEVIIGCFPPCVCAKILFTSTVEKRVTPALLKVDLLNANVHLTFSCTFKEEPTPTSLESIVSSGSTPGPSQSGATPSSSPQADVVLSKPADMLKALNHQLDAKWWEFGTLLYVGRDIMGRIQQNKSDVEACMLQLVEKWLHHDDGTGDLPRTWGTVVQAVKDAGNGLLAEQLAKQFGVQLSGH